MRIRIAFLLTLLTLLTITSCDDAKRKVEKKNYADSLINAAQKEGDLERMLALVDSLEPTGLLSDIRINQARGWVYNRMGQRRRSEIYYQKVVNAEPQNDQQRSLQNTVAINLTSRQVAKGDYEAALKVAIETVKRMEQNKEQNIRALGALYNTIGACQLNLGHDEEAEKYYEQAYDFNMQVCEKDEKGIDSRQSIDAMVNTVIDYCNAKKYNMVLPWLQRTRDMIGLYERKPHADTISAFDFRIRLQLLEAIALQGLGDTKKAAQIYESVKDTEFGRSADGRLTANDYLLAAGRYSEAADNFRDLDHVIDDWGLDLSLETIQLFLIPKLRANVGADRKDSVSRFSIQLADALDKAIEQNKSNTTAELAAIYETEQKEAEIALHQARIQQQRFIGTAGVLVLFVVFFILYSAYRRKAEHRLAVANDKLQSAYDQLEETTTQKERIESELRIARDIQMSMVPHVFPKHQGLDLYATMKPAKEVGGDLYSYLVVEDLLYFCVGDVSGKGVPASLFMAQVARMFRTLSAQRMKPEQIATEMNNELTEDNEMGMFVTLFIGLVDMNTGHLFFCNAGHNPPVMGDGDLGGRFMDVESNAPIGLWPDLQFVGQELESVKDHPLFVYSDGLNEAENKEQQQFGDEQLLEILHKTRYETAQQVIEVMEREVERHRNGALPNDDLTMLCLRVN
ncbi:MAG: SpoIIE family protein phosphatase [Prevotella sp.]|nr:SpoIIE family protein phosphatase [Prevotella sp.]